MTTIVKTLADAKQIKFGDQYIIDVLPTPFAIPDDFKGDVQKLADNYDKEFAAALELEAEIQGSIEKRLSSDEEEAETEEETNLSVEDAALLKHFIEAPTKTLKKEYDVPELRKIATHFGLSTKNGRKNKKEDELLACIIDYAVEFLGTEDEDIDLDDEDKRYVAEMENV